MKISVNDQEVYTLAEWEKDVIKNDIHADDFDADMKRRLEWVLRHKAEQCYIRFEKEWLEKLRNDPSVDSIPKSKEAFVALVKSRQDYKDRATRDAEAKLAGTP
jgi:hypothetical protein